MKFKFSLKNQEVSLDADVERLIDKGMDYKAKNPPPKTRYQIKQEEKRKAKEQEQKHFIQRILLMCGFILFILAVCGIGTLIGLE